MGQSTDGILAYGYDLGGGEEDWKVRETGEYGDLTLDWLDPDDDETGFSEAAEKLLLASVGFTEEWASDNDGYFERERAAQAQVGVELEEYCSGTYPMWLLAAKVIRVARGDVKVIDPVALATEATEQDWDEKLAAALRTLGLTPTQERPCWLLASYWG